MSKKQARQKKMAQVEASLKAQLAERQQPKLLTITPQIPVTIQGAFPNQGLFVERPNQSGTRHKIELTPDNAYSTLMGILAEKVAEIELERAAHQSARDNRRKSRQPDWITIASHPQAEIREGLIAAHLTAKGSISILPTRARELTATKASNTLDEMGL